MAIQIKATHTNRLSMYITGNSIRKSHTGIKNKTGGGNNVGEGERAGNMEEGNEEQVEEECSS